MAAAALIAAMPLTKAAAQEILAYNSTGGNATTGYWGQSFTVAGVEPTFRSITFQLQRPDGTNVGTAGSKVYLFSNQYGGTTANIATANFLGSATSNNGTYSFNPSLTLSTGSQYFAYSDSSLTVSYASTNTYTGGNVYYAPTAGDVYTSYANFDARFFVTGIAAAAPEPATWAFMILGFGVVGGTLRSRRRLEGSKHTALVAA